MGVLESYWLRIWSRSYDVQSEGSDGTSVNYYLMVYAVISFGMVIIETIRLLQCLRYIFDSELYATEWFILYNGGIRASVIIYKG